MRDNDHLFVSFSKDALEGPVGRPPFHDDIGGFAASLTRESFREFFEGRHNWHWYPIVTSGLSSFPAHGDLPDKLDAAGILQAIGYAAEICASEEGKRFVSALGLLSLLCRSVEDPTEVPALTRHFMAIRSRVSRNAIDPNIPYWFSKIALYQLATNAIPEGYQGSFNRAGLNAPETAQGGKE